ncbi:MAG: DUF4097 domain-containing protein [Acidobacteria bacterium]|nr:DUF4097 domain-containing protein [Acidobacteriota bacterium]
MRYLLIALAIGLTGCDIDIDDVAGGAREEETFQMTKEFAPGDRLIVDNYNGSVEITGWDRNDIEITGAKYAHSRERLNEIKIDVSRGAGLLTVRTVPPASRMGNHGARYVIRVPKRATLELIKSSNGQLNMSGLQGSITARTSNGTIRTAKIQGDVSASSTNGTIECIDVSGAISARTTNGRIKLESIEGPMDASTTNGPIFAEMKRSTDDRKMRFSTSNGSIDLRLPAGLKNDVRASTTNGSIKTQMPAGSNFQVSARTTSSSISSDFDIQGDISKRRIEGRIGSGGPILDLSTTNGGISLQRGL